MTFNLKFILVTIIILVYQTGVLFIDNSGNTSNDVKSGRVLKKLAYEEIFSNELTEWNKNYEKTIRAIKKHEGFAGGKPYICPGGFATIGYGHVIKEGEHFIQLTEKQADSLLRVDFNKALKAVDASVKLNGPKKLAIAHFVFAKGIGTFNRSELKTKVVKGESIDDEIIKWLSQSANGCKICNILTP